MTDNAAEAVVEQGGWRHFFAGTFAGMAGVFFGHPFDTVKVRLQTQTPGPDGKLPFKGAIHCAVTTLRREGIRGLYKGLSSPLLGDSATNALVFGVYGAARNAQLEDGQNERDHFHTLSLGQIFTAGCAVGVAAAVLLAPVELIKIRLQVQTESNQKLYSGPIDCIIKTVKRDGIKGLGRGITATWLRDIPAFGAYFWCYEGLRRWMAKEGQRVDEIAPWKQLVAGGLGGIATWLVSYPMDVVKSRIQTDSTYRSTWHCIKASYKAEGLSVFFIGLETTVVRAFPVNAIIFITYEVLMKVLYMA